jgi:hypothetical protein
MACTGHSNTPNGVACTGYVAPVSAVSWTDPVPQSVAITAAQFSQLRTAVLQELTRRSTSYVIPTVSINVVIHANEWREVRNGINACKAWTFPSTVDNTALAVGANIQADSIVALRSKVNTLKAECVCNCNYACTCNCNYPCTCDCNYSCTCNCNYPCTCNCNYTCTCDCNYSDERLKIDIDFI